MRSLLLLSVLAATMVLGDDVPAFCEAYAPCSKTSSLDFSEDESYNIIWLEAPLLESKYNNTLGLLGLKHAGIGFSQVSDPTKTWGLEYVATSGFLKVLFPHILRDGSGQASDIAWCDSATVCHYAGLDPDYWNPAVYPSAKSVEVGVIDGASLIKFVNTWLAEQIVNPLPYTLWGVSGHDNKLFLSTYTCQNWAHDALDVLGTQFNAQLNCQAIANITMVNPMLRASHPPVEVPLNSEVISFYSQYPDPASAKITDFIKLFEKLLIHEQKFHHISRSYYQFQALFPPGELMKQPLTVESCVGKKL